MYILFINEIQLRIFATYVYLNLDGENGMLFERFVFVLYIVGSYTCFLLATTFGLKLRFVPLIAMCLSLLSVIVVSLLQLQKLIKHAKLGQNDRWSTVVWSAVHVQISILFFIDGFEWMNIMVLLSVAGLLLTVLIAVVGICSCYVIIQNSQDWMPHVHLTCISFWVLVQYMSIRLPMDDIAYVTTIPVVAMAFLRLAEHVEDGVNMWSLAEGVLWTCCIAGHVCLDVGMWSQKMFLYVLLLVVVFIVAASRHRTKVGLLVSLPFILVPLGLHVGFRYTQGYHSTQIGDEIMKMYDELTAAPPNEPFELNPEEDDFDTRL